jgi:hypothetical protein
MILEQTHNAGAGMTADQMSAFLASLGEHIARIGEEMRQNAAKTDAQMAKTDAQMAITVAQMAKTDAIVAETSAKVAELTKVAEETSKVVEETSREVKKTSREVKNTSKNIGNVNNKLGKFLEYMFSARVWDKFDDYGYEFTKGTRDVKYFAGGSGKRGRPIAEVDVLLENGDYIMAIEVKFDLVQEDIDDHVKRMLKIREYMDQHEDKRKLVGAIAAGIAPDNMRVYAENHGFYVLVQSGEDVMIAEEPHVFKAKEW